MSYEYLLYEVSNHILTITLNRPDSLNSFNDELSFELQEALKAATKDKDVRCIVLTGAGRGFCAGQDLKSRSIASNKGEKPHLGGSIKKRYAPIIKSLRTIEKPVIAKINGVAAGAGASIAFACDMRITVDTAKFIQAFVKVGLIPDSGACWLLPRLVGFGRAMAMIMTGEPVDAHQALVMGLVNQVVSAEELDAATQKLAEQLANGPTKALGLMKRAMNKAVDLSLDEFLEYEGDLQEIAGQTEDYLEGVSAFTEKRNPDFKGQ